jgi:hypothetical protein
MKTRNKKDDFIDLMDRLWSVTHDYHIREREMDKKSWRQYCLNFTDINK